MDQEQTRTFLIAGLGNPGREYRFTRHNVGFMVIDRLGADLGVRLSRLQSRALVGAGAWEGQKVVLAKPQTYMNLSGQAVSSLVRFYRLPLEQLLVVHDEIDLPFGTLRMRPGGGSAGQKGLGSIIEQLGTQEFPRLRIGVGRPQGQRGAADYVLGEFTNGDQDVLEQVLDEAVAAVKAFLKLGLTNAMNQFNGPVIKE